MSRKTTRSLKREVESRHPSKFFFVALAIGVALLIWLFVQAVRHPTKPRLHGLGGAPPPSAAPSRRMAGEGAGPPLSKARRAAG
jgi:hypothetical protein